MIKRFLTTISTVAITIVCFADIKPIDLNVYYEPVKSTHIPTPKSPIKIPTIYIENNILYFESILDNYVLQIISVEDEETIIYSGIISPGETTYQLPTNIVGNYIIKLYNDAYAFIGYTKL